MTFQRPLNSSISAMSLRISGVIVMFLILCMGDIHFQPFLSVSYPKARKYPIPPICSHSISDGGVKAACELRGPPQNALDGVVETSCQSFRLQPIYLLHLSPEIAGI
jgi:hypothetical protein